MPAFELLWIRWLLIMTVVGLGLTLALVLACYLPGRPGRGPANEETEEYAADIRMANRGSPLFLWLVYAGTFIFIIAYLLWVWLARASF